MEQPWLQHYDPPVPPELEFETAPLHTYLDQTARRCPDHAAIRYGKTRTTYAELRAAAEVVAGNLRLRGVGKGDRVAVMLPNLPQTIVTFWGIMRAGGVAVMTNPLYMETELTHQFSDSGAKLLVTADVLWPRIAPILDSTPVETCFLVDTSGSGVTSGERGARAEPWEALLQPGAAAPDVAIDPLQDLAVLQYTGGTTGLAKGCMLTHANLGANMQQLKAMFHVLEEGQEAFVGVLPYFHIYGLTVGMNGAVVKGGTMLPLPRFTPAGLLELIDHERPTCLPCAPSIFLALLRQKDIATHDLTSLKLCISGSAPMPVKQMERFEQLTGAVISEGYGLSEASPATHFNPIIGKRKPGSIGLPLPSTDARIVDVEQGTRLLPPGEEGELVVRGPQVMAGYYRQPEETAQVLRNGWLHTGDICTMDEEGYFYVVDRKKDLILTGGYNVYPRELEEVLYTHPSIAEAVVIGVPHDTRGEVPKAFVVLVEGRTLERRELIAYCRARLANYKVPRAVEFRESLPKSAVGKILRRALREEG